MTTLSVLSEGDWPAFVQSYGLDGIPFLETLVAHAARRMNLAGLAVVASDAVRGRISLYLGRNAASVVCCVADADEAAHLNEWLTHAGIRSVSVRLDVSAFPGGPTVLPFIKTRFDAALLAVSVLFSPTTEQAIKEVVSVLRPGGRLGLIVWSPLLPSNPADFADPRNILRPVAPGSPRDYSRPVVDAVANAGFRNVRSEPCTCQCLAPSRAAFMRVRRKRLIMTTKGMGSALERHLDQTVGPVALESWAALVLAEAPT